MITKKMSAVIVEPKLVKYYFFEVKHNSNVFLLNIFLKTFQLQPRTH